MAYDIYTDGACRRNPGRGGIGAVVYRNGVIEKTFSQGYIASTNQRMELLAVVFVLKEYANKRDVTIWTDSQYVRCGITEWMAKWKLNGWRRRDGVKKLRPVKNVDLWKEIDALTNKNIQYRWVKGHSHEIGNEIADKLATSAADQGPFLSDDGYGNV